VTTCRSDHILGACEKLRASGILRRLICKWGAPRPDELVWASVRCLEKRLHKPSSTRPYITGMMTVRAASEAAPDRADVGRAGEMRCAGNVRSVWAVGCPGNELLEDQPFDVWVTQALMEFDRN